LAEVGTLKLAVLHILPTCQLPQVMYQMTCTKRYHWN